MSDEQSVQPGEPNRPVWSREASVYAIEGWSDPGELEALCLVAGRVRGLPALDIGVGGGRTVALLRLLTDVYIGVDYTPEMVDLCRRRHPDADIRLEDARDLASIASGEQGFVMFSSNGIDAVDHDGRRAVLANMARVLQPGGIALYSTLNKDGPFYRADPSTVPDLEWEPGSLLPARPAPGQGDDWPEAVRNWRRLRSGTVDEGDWGMSPFAAHRFSLLTHFVTLQGVYAELAEAGLTPLAVFACEDGSAISADATTTTTKYMHVVATKPDGATA